MKTSDLIAMSIRSLWRRKVRTALTILGVIIGASSIILMLSLGIAMDESFKARMESMGQLTIIDVYTNSWDNPDGPKLDEEGIRILSSIEGVQMVIPERSTRAYLEIGNYRTNWQMDIKGLSPEEMRVMGYEVSEGRNMQPGDEKVILIGEELLREFARKGQEIDWRNPPPPLEVELGVDEVVINIAEIDYETKKPVEVSYDTGRKIRMPKDQNLEIIGIFPSHDYQVAYSAFVPLELFDTIVANKEKYLRELHGDENYENMYGYEDSSEYRNAKVKVENENLVVDVLEEIQEMGYRGYSPMEYLTEMRKMSNSIQMMLGGIGAISLIVAAIGIANTMMMSIYERTREIGIMKVIGAKIQDIKKLFLVEALLIGAIGGLLGVIFSYLLSYGINTYGPEVASELANALGGGEKISIIPLWLAIGGLVFSAIIGLISGYFPARRAMKLSALTAIKTE